MNKYFIFAIIACIGFIFSSVKSCKSTQQERDRLSNNQRALLEDITLYRTKDSLSAASVEKLTLTKNELEKYNGKLAQTVKDLGIKVKNLQSVSQTVTATNYTATATVKDSIVPRIDRLSQAADEAGKTAFDTLHCVKYSDAYLSFEGCSLNNELNFKIKSVDTLIQIVHRVPKRWLFFRYGTKAIRQEILSKNPHTNIIYTEYIELSK